MPTSLRFGSREPKLTKEADSRLNICFGLQADCNIDLCVIPKMRRGSNKEVKILKKLFPSCHITAWLENRPTKENCKELHHQVL